MRKICLLFRLVYVMFYSIKIRKRDLFIWCAQKHLDYNSFFHTHCENSNDAHLYNKYDYNIPRACLLNRPPVPAMDLKSNRSGLWRHMLETCRRLRRLCRKRSDDVSRHDKTPVKSKFLSRDKNILSLDMIYMSRRSDIMLWLLHI